MLKTSFFRQTYIVCEYAKTCIKQQLNIFFN